MKKIIVFLVFLFIFANVAYAGDDIIGYLTQEIYEECKGKDIELVPGLLKYTSIGKEPQSFVKLEYPYSKEELGYVISVIVKNDPYSLIVNNDRESFIELLSCGESTLRVNFDTYYWKGERADPFYYNYQQIIQSAENIVTEKFQQFAQTGESNIIATGGSTVSEEETNWFSKNNLSVGSVVFNITLYIILSLALYLILKIKLKNK